MDSLDKGSVNFGRNIKSAAIGIICGLFVNAGLFFYQKDDAPVPYNDVARFSIEETADGDINYQATFNKLEDGCQFERLAVLGVELGQSHVLKWNDNDGYTGSENRVKGEHVLDITIDSEEHEPEEIEIRTRHTCDIGDGEDVLVTKVFDRFTTFEVDGEQ